MALSEAELRAVLDGITAGTVKHDGDGTGAMRIQGYDSAEVDHGRGGTDVHPAGERDSAALRHMLSLGEVDVESNGTDTYGRALVSPTVDGEDVAGKMVQAGFGLSTSDDTAGMQTSGNAFELLTGRRSDDPTLQALYEDRNTEPWSFNQPGAIIPTNHERNPDSVLGNAVDRGVSDLKTATGGAAKLLGELIGSDDLQEWGTAKLSAGTLESQLNPRAVESVHDIESVTDGVNYVIETVGETLPSLPIDIAAGLVGGGVGGVAARRGLTVAAKEAAKDMAKGMAEASAKGVGGEAARRYAARQGLDAVVKDAAEDTVVDALKDAAVASAKRKVAVGAAVGSGASAAVQGAGGMEAQLEAAGFEDTAFESLAQGAVSGAAAMLPVGMVLDRVLGQIGKGAGQKAVTDRIKEAMATAVVGGAAELPVSAVESVSNQVLSAMGTEQHDRELDIAQVIDDTIRGVVGGGAFGAAAGGMGQLVDVAYNAHKGTVEAERQANELVKNNEAALKAQQAKITELNNYYRGFVQNHGDDDQKAATANSDDLGQLYEAFASTAATKYGSAAQKEWFGKIVDAAKRGESSPEQYQSQMEKLVNALHEQMPAHDRFRTAGEELTPERQQHVEPNEALEVSERRLQDIEGLIQTNQHPKGMVTTWTRLVEDDLVTVEELATLAEQRYGVPRELVEEFRAGDDQQATLQRSGELLGKIYGKATDLGDKASKAQKAAVATLREKGDQVTVGDVSEAAKVFGLKYGDDPFRRTMKAADLAQMAQQYSREKTDAAAGVKDPTAVMDSAVEDAQRKRKQAEVIGGGKIHGAIAKQAERPIPSDTRRAGPKQRKADIKRARTVMAEFDRLSKMADDAERARDIKAFNRARVELIQAWGDMGGTVKAAFNQQREDRAQAVIESMTKSLRHAADSGFVGKKQVLTAGERNAIRHQLAEVERAARNGADTTETIGALQRLESTAKQAFGARFKRAKRVEPVAFSLIKAEDRRLADQLRAQSKAHPKERMDDLSRKLQSGELSRDQVMDGLAELFHEVKAGREKHEYVESAGFADAVEGSNPIDALGNYDDDDNWSLDAGKIVSLPGGTARSYEDRATADVETLLALRDSLAVDSPDTQSVRFAVDLAIKFAAEPSPAEQMQYQADSGENMPANAGKMVLRATKHGRQGRHHKAGAEPMTLTSARVHAGGRSANSFTHPRFEKLPEDIMKAHVADKGKYGENTHRVMQRYDLVTRDFATPFEDKLRSNRAKGRGVKVKVGDTDYKITGTSLTRGGMRDAGVELGTQLKPAEALAYFLDGFSGLKLEASLSGGNVSRYSDLDPNLVIYVNPDGDAITFARAFRDASLARQRADYGIRKGRASAPKRETVTREITKADGSKVKVTIKVDAGYDEFRRTISALRSHLNDLVDAPATRYGRTITADGFNNDKMVERADALRDYTRAQNRERLDKRQAEIDRVAREGMSPERQEAVEDQQNKAPRSEVNDGTDPSMRLSPDDPSNKSTARNRGWQSDADTALHALELQGAAYHGDYQFLKGALGEDAAMAIMEAETPDSRLDRVAKYFDTADVTGVIDLDGNFTDDGIASVFGMDAVRSVNEYADFIDSRDTKSPQRATDVTGETAYKGSRLVMEEGFREERYAGTTIKFKPGKAPSPAALRRAEAKAQAELRSSQAARRRTVNVARRFFEAKITRLERVMPDIAAKIYRRTGDVGDGSVTFEAGVEHEMHQWFGRLEKHYGSSTRSAKRMQQDYDDVLAGKRNELSKMLDALADYAKKNDPTFQKPDAPLILNVAEIEQRTAGFAALLKEHLVGSEVEGRRDKDGNVVKISEADIDALVTEYVTRDGHPDGGAEFTPRKAPGAKRLANNPALRQALVDAGFVQMDAPSVMSKYIAGIIQRAEWSRTFGGHTGGQFNPNFYYDQMVGQMNRFDKNYQEGVRILQAITGQYKQDVHPGWRKFNATTTGLNNLRLLLFSGVASIPELALPYVRSKEVMGATEGILGFARTMASKEGRAALLEFSRDLGLLSDKLASHSLEMLYNSGEMTVGKTMHRLTDRMFKLNGQHAIVKLNRLQAAYVSRMFLAKHAQGKTDKSERLLRELGITADQVKLALQAEEALGRMPDPLDVEDATTREAVDKYRRAVTTFTGQSVLNPKRSETPLFADDPHLAMLAHLKNYMYAFWSVFHRGIVGNEIKARAGTEPSMMGYFKGAMTYSPMMAATMLMFMGLGAVSREIRDLAKWRGDKPEHLELSTADTLWDNVTRSGLLGPAATAEQLFMSNGWGGNRWAYAAGPNFDLVFNTIMNGDFTTRPSELMPFLPVLPKDSRMVNEVWRDMTASVKDESY